MFRSHCARNSSLHSYACVLACRSFRFIRTFCTNWLMATLTKSTVRNMQPVCQNCQTSTTPLWRRDEMGSVLCNACGLFLKLHGRPRPISLKTDVIKSRNRVKSTGQMGRRKVCRRRTNLNEYAHGQTNQHWLQFSAQYPGQHPDMGTPPPTHPSHRRISDQHMPSYDGRSASPISRTGTPTYQLHPHTAPQLGHHPYDPTVARSPSPMHMHTAAYHHSQSAPSSATHRAVSPHHNLSLPPPHTNGHLQSPSLNPAMSPTYAELQTRVSELEVINSLYQGKIQDMESARRHSEDRIRELEDALKHRDDRDRQLARELDQLRARPVNDADFKESVSREAPATNDANVPQRSENDATNHALTTGSVKRRRGRTLEKENQVFHTKRRETGEYPDPAQVSVHG